MSKQISTKEEQELIDEGFRDWIENLPEKTFDLSKDKEKIFLEFCDRMLEGAYREEENTKASSRKIAKAVLKSYYVAGKENEILPYVDKEAWKIKPRETFALITKFVNEFFTDEKVEFTNFEDFKKTLSNITAKELSKIYGSCIQVNSRSNKVVDTGFKLSITRSLLDMGYVEQAGFLVDGPQAQINEKYQQHILNMYINVANTFIRQRAGLRKKMDDERYDLVWATVERYLENCENLMTEKTKQNSAFKSIKQDVEKYFESKHELRHHYTLSGIYGDYYNTVISCVKRFKSKTNTEEDKEIVESFLEKTREINKALAYKDSHGRSYACNYFVYTTTPPMSMLYLIGEFYKNVPNLKDEDIKMLIETKSLIRRAFGEKMKNKQTVQSYPDSLRMFKYKTREFDLTDQANFDKFATEVEKKVEKYHLPKTELCVQIVGADMLRGKEPIKIDELESVKAVKTK